jgi:hypothetical protein
VQNENVVQENKYAYFQNEYVHEVLHILAHTLNEYGVKLRNNLLRDTSKKSDDRIPVFLVAARALMLYVAKNQEFMVDCQKCLTCLATLHAEVGDFVSAKSQLIENVSSNYYKNKDILVQAEIEFFYYVISMMDNPIEADPRRDAFFQKYVNCCYNSFDYDALAQIEMYRFKYSIAEAIIKGTRSTNGNVRENFRNLQASFNAFLQTTQTIYVSDWTKNEYEKIKTTFQLLTKYYGLNDINKALSVVDLAKKYLYIYAKSVNFSDFSMTTDFESSDSLTLVAFLDSVFNQPIKTQYLNQGKIQIRNCVFIDISSMQNLEATAVFDNARNDSDHVYIIADNNNYLSEKRERHIWIDTETTASLQYFLVQCAIDSIMYDFVNPQNLFILVPFVGAEPLKYQLNSFTDLLLKIEHTQNTSSLTQVAKLRRLSTNFTKNYILDNSSLWVKEIMQQFSEAELVLWNDEDTDTIYSKERYYSFDREGGEAHCLPMINYWDFIETLDGLFSEEDISFFHNNCPNGECRERILDNQGIAKCCLNHFFISPSFGFERLQNKKIIILYNSRRRQWRIIVVGNSISSSDFMLLQAHICGNRTYVEENRRKLTFNPEVQLQYAKGGG